MNAYVKKEIRLLLPTFSIGLVWACLFWLAPALAPSASAFKNFVSATIYSAGPIIVTSLALDSFGREFGAGTFSNLLAQPVPRLRIWRVKTSLLAAAFAILLGVAMASAYFIPSLFPNSRRPSEGLTSAIIFIACIFSGGLWTTLLLRQVAAAFWFTLLIPGALAFVISVPVAQRFPDAEMPLLITVLGLYSVGGFFFARRLFLRAQDVAWSGGELIVLELRGLARFKTGSANARGWRPRAALLAKEFQLHQVQFMLAGALAVLHLGVLAARKFGTFEHTSSVKFTLEFFWVLWLFLPLLVGGAAVAEERKLGTLEAQLCLPVKRRTQFALKLGVVLLLSVLLGAVMPFLFEGTRILISKPHLSKDMNHLATQSAQAVWLIEFIRQFYRAVPYLFLVGAPALIGALAFFISTLTRNMLQALGPAVLFILAAAALLGTAWLPEVLFNYPLWRGALIYFIGVPILLVALVRLAFGNFQRVRVAGALWLRNALVLLAALAAAMTVTTALYQRAWEFLPGSEPTHGVARIANPRGVEFHTTSMWRLTAKFADGRVWVGDASGSFPKLWDFLVEKSNAKILPSEAKFLDGAGWQSVSLGLWDIVGVRRDGSLWVSEKPSQPITASLKGTAFSVRTRRLEQLGVDHDWKLVQAFPKFALLLKTDGSLWELGTDKLDDKILKTNGWPGLRTFVPRRVGNDSDWSDIFPGWYANGFRKTDGAVWLRENDSAVTNVTVLMDDVKIKRVVGSENFIWRSQAHANISHGGGIEVGVGDDGTFRVWRADELIVRRKSQLLDELIARRKSQLIFQPGAQNIQLGSVTNWLAVAGDYGSVVTLKADGTLWHWHFPDDSLTTTAYATQLGTRTDWVAITGTYGAVFALAADGSVWQWRFNPFWDYSDSDSLGFDPLLGVSRHPRKLGNIFDAEK